MKFYNKLFLIAIFSIGIWLIQTEKASAQMLIEPEFLSVSDGVASPTVNDILQDSYGVLWLATSNGLQKYDGYSFQTYKYVPGVSSSLQDNYVWGLMEDANHDLWVSTNLGVSRFIREKNEFVNYNFTVIFNFTSNSQVSGFRLLVDSKQRLWATSTVIELVRYDPDEDTWFYADYDLPSKSEPPYMGFSPQIVEGPDGGLWIGSLNYGLLYMSKDSEAFQPVLSDSLNRATFLDRVNNITGLYWDASNILWITTKNGIYKYNHATGTFKTIKEYVDQAMNSVWNNWNCIIPDEEGNIWIANNFRGILKFDGISDQYEEVHVDGAIKTNTQGWTLTITNITIDHSGIFWMGTREEGLLKYNPVSKPFSFYDYDENNENGISLGGAYGVLASKYNPGLIYVGTRGDGLNILDSNTGRFTKVGFESQNDLFGGSVRSIGETQDGSIYLGTWGDGLIQLDKNYNEIARFHSDPLNSNSITNNRVRVIKQDSQDHLWVGTNDGLNVFDPGTGLFRRVLSKMSISYPDSLVADANRKLDSDQVLAIIKDVTDSQDLSEEVAIQVAGTYFIVFVGEGDEVDGPADYGWLENEARDTLWAFSDYAQSYHAGGNSKNRIVITPVTLQPGAYRIRYLSDDSHSYGKWNEDEPTKTALYGIALIKPSDKKQTDDWISMIEENKNEITILGNNINDIEINEPFVWVAASGLSQIDLSNNTVKQYVHDPLNDNSLASNLILDIERSHDGMIWLATDAGVDQLDPKTGAFIHYTEEDGLPTNLIQTLLEGDDGEMWIATQNGLSHMISNDNLGKVTFINYNSTDGLGGNTFLYGAADLAPDGRFYFGGDHGLTTFGDIMTNNTPPSIIISDLMISNKSIVKMGDDSPLQKSLQETERITLSSKQNNLSFEFAALHYANPKKNQYAHILKGYDREWSYDNRNFAIYTNLDPGKYELIIRASNAYGIWNETGKSLEIIINAPWWRTIWAYLSYLVIFGIFLFLFNRMMRQRIQRRERERTREKELAQAREIEMAYEELKATQAQLIQSEKMASLGELTAGIAHEIQNPLNFINNFAELNTEMIEEADEEFRNGNTEEGMSILNDIKGNEQKISHHGKRADGIVKGMLQHSRSSSGNKEAVDLNSLADEYLRLAFHGLRAKDKSFNADFRMEAEANLPEIPVSQQDIGRVLLNLINNAFYAVTEKSKDGSDDYKPLVVVSTHKQTDHIEIRVKDNGNGIPDSVKDKIFQPFFTTKPTGEGTGLGLSMSYDIISKGHGGTIEVKSQAGEGSVFIIKLPLSPE